jgi:hypothetical protein
LTNTGDQEPSERIVIRWEDLDDVPDTPPARAATGMMDSPGGAFPGPGALPGLGPQPVPMQIAVPDSGGVLSRLGANTVMSGLTSGAVGGLIGFFFAETIKNPSAISAQTSGGLDAQTALWVMIFGILVGALLLAWDGITSSSWQKALNEGAIGALIGALAGFLGGFISQALYSKMFDHAVNTATTLNGLKGDLIVSRVVGWSVFGLLLGAGIGLRGGRRRLLNGLIGGVAGAAAGGLVFQLIGNSSTSSDGFWPRLIGLTATGIGIGLAVGLVERARRDSWVRIVAGPMAGKEFILYKDQTTLGRDYRCDIVLAKDPAAMPVHATFVRDQSGNVSVLPGPGATIAVNGLTSAGGRLRSSDTITVGSSTLAYSERVVTPAPVAATMYR